MPQYTFENAAAGIARARALATEPNRLYYRLGWTRGWYKGALRDKTFGLLVDESRTADLKAAKAKLLDLARKYDRA